MPARRQHRRGDGTTRRQALALAAARSAASAARVMLDPANALEDVLWAAHERTVECSGQHGGRCCGCGPHYPCCYDTTAP